MADTTNAAGERTPHALTAAVRRLCELKALDDDPLVQAALELVAAIEAEHLQRPPAHDRITLRADPTGRAAVLIDGHLVLGIDLETGAIGSWPAPDRWQVFGRLDGSRLVPLLPGTLVRVVRAGDTFFGRQGRIADNPHPHISGWLTVEFTDPSRRLRPLVRFYPANALEAC